MMPTPDRRPPPFRLLPRVTRCDAVGMSYLRWGRRLWFSFDAPAPRRAPPPAAAHPVPWPIAAGRILTIAALAWVVAAPMVVAAVGDLPARVLP